MAKKKAAKKTRNRKAQDATLINVDALKRRANRLASRLSEVDKELDAVSVRLKAIEDRIGID